MFDQPYNYEQWKKACEGELEEIRRQVEKYKEISQKGTSIAPSLVFEPDNLLEYADKIAAFLERSIPEETQYNFIENRMDNINHQLDLFKSAILASKKDPEVARELGDEILDDQRSRFEELRKRFADFYIQEGTLAMTENEDFKEAAQAFVKAAEYMLEMEKMEPKDLAEANEKFGYMLSKLAEHTKAVQELTIRANKDNQTIPLSNIKEISAGQSGHVEQNQGQKPDYLGIAEERNDKTDSITEKNAQKLDQNAKDLDRSANELDKNAVKAAEAKGLFSRIVEKAEKFFENRGNENFAKAHTLLGAADKVIVAAFKAAETAAKVADQSRAAADQVRSYGREVASLNRAMAIACFKDDFVRNAERNGDSPVSNFNNMKVSKMTPKEVEKFSEELKASLEKQKSELETLLDRAEALEDKKESIESAEKGEKKSVFQKLFKKEPEVKEVNIVHKEDIEERLKSIEADLKMLPDVTKDVMDRAAEFTELRDEIADVKAENAKESADKFDAYFKEALDAPQKRLFNVLPLPKIISAGIDAFQKLNEEHREKVKEVSLDFIELKMEMGEEPTIGETYIWLKDHFDHNLEDAYKKLDDLNKEYLGIDENDEHNQ